MSGCSGVDISGLLPVDGLEGGPGSENGGGEAIPPGGPGDEGDMEQETVIIDDDEYDAVDLGDPCDYWVTRWGEPDEIGDGDFSGDTGYKWLLDDGGYMFLSCREGEVTGVTLQR